MQDTEAAPFKLNARGALQVIRKIAADSKNIIVIAHGKARARQRQFTRMQIERCVRKGTVSEGPFMNVHGNWQVNLTSHAAGEEITCVVAIEWAARVIVITVF
jgi:hypothetical protein